MAAKIKAKQRTISFYEVVALADGEERRLPQLPWPDVLANVSRMSLGSRRVDIDVTLIGSVVTYDDDHLLLHRVKDPGEWLSAIDWGTGEVNELEERAVQGLLDTSVICFLPFGNVFALMHGSVASPSHRALASWLNGLEPFEDTVFTARPLMSPSEVEQLRTADGASRVEIRVGTARASALEGKSGRLATVLQRATELYGDVKVTMTISVPRGRGRTEDRQKLLNDLENLEDVMPGAAERAEATLTYVDDSGPERRMLTQFVEHHITAKRRVRALDDEGNAIRIWSAVGVILDVVAEHEDELRRSAGVS